MKIKVIPEDFIVTELIDLPCTPQGRYTLLRLEKRLWNTLDVIQHLADHLSVPRRRFYRAGLKDRYALSTQYLSFDGTIDDTIQEKNFTVTPVGRTPQPVSAAALLGNEFTITLRKLLPMEIDRVHRNAGEIDEQGLPNYFDDQRFGSARHGRGFFARALLHQHYRGALKLLICYPHPDDTAAVKRFKTCCEQHWGHWHHCAHMATREYRGIMRYLSEHPRAIKGALRYIDREYGNLYLLAYQSYLFNKMARQVIQEHGIQTSFLPYVAGDFMFYRTLKDRHRLLEMELPMITHDLAPGTSHSALIRSVLDEEGITLKSFSLNTMRFRGIRFKKHWRGVILMPRNMTILSAGPDERYPGKKKLTLRFTLPPGSYATLVVKRLLLER